MQPFAPLAFSCIFKTCKSEEHYEISYFMCCTQSNFIFSVRILFFIPEELRPCNLHFLDYGGCPLIPPSHRHSLSRFFGGYQLLHLLGRPDVPIWSRSLLHLGGVLRLPARIPVYSLSHRYAAAFLKAFRRLHAILPVGKAAFHLL